MEKLIIYFLILMRLLSNTQEEILIKGKQECLESCFTKMQQIVDSRFELVEEDCIKYSTTSLNIRTLPSTDSDILGTFFFGEEVHITAKVENSTWVQVLVGKEFGFCNGAYLSNTKPQKVERSGDIQIIGNISDDFIDSVYAYYNKISDNVKNRLKKEGWVIYITNENLSSKFGFDFSILAITVMDTNINQRDIYISNRDAAKKSILHEMGHAIDLSLGTISSSEEFNSIYQEEVGAFASWHSTHKNNYNTTLEYFAECYQEMILHPTNMQTYCPKTYEYLLNIISNF